MTKRIRKLLGYLLIACLLLSGVSALAEGVKFYRYYLERMNER